MESSTPVQFSKFLAEDYQHFEHTHLQYPQEAHVVFGRVSDLRAALQAFREATLGAKAVVSEAPVVTLEGEAPAVILEGEAPATILEGDAPAVILEEASQPVLLGSVEGSTEQHSVDGVIDLTGIDSAESEVNLITAAAATLVMPELNE
jgi:hypothetical protein